jgi:glycosyltransferase involved in cell wall biosynthesis
MICPFASPNIGGVEAHLDKLIGKLLALGHRVYLIAYQPLTTKTRGAAYEKNGNLEIHRVQWFGYNLFHKLEQYYVAQFLYLFPGLFIKSLIFYVQHHRELDVIHAHGLTGALIAKILKKIHGKRAVISTHAVYNLETRRFLALLVKYILKDFDKVLAVGEMSKRELIYIGIQPDRIAIHPNWINLKKFRPEDKITCRNKLQIDSGRFTVIYLGRLIEQKGVRVLLETAGEMDHEINFVFAGDGPLSEDIRAAAKERKNVLFLGKLDKAGLVSFYNAGDLFVLPSQYNEGFATVILESLACGVPVLATNKGCVPWYVDKTVGDLIDPSKENLKAKIDYYHKNRAALDAKARVCRGYAERCFSESNFEVILRSYDE